MLIDEITRSCSNEKVASAAVASIGLAFASRVRAKASEQGITSGALAAKAVRDFARFASDADRNRVYNVMRYTDQPLLVGLRHIIEPALNHRCDLGRHRTSDDGTERRAAC